MRFQRVSLKSKTMTKPYVIGIDIGGTNTVFGIVDARGQVIASNSIRTQKHADFNDYIDELCQSAVGRHRSVG